LVTVSHLNSGSVRSCGCIKREQTIEQNRRIAKRGGLTKHPLYGTWTLMVNRCHNPNAGNYRWYGARGISVWEPWRTDARAFIEYIEKNLGPRPAGMSLDRINNDKNYEPGNLRWNDAVGQARNRGASRPDGC
jgi:hypothetical protein